MSVKKLFKKQLWQLLLQHASYNTFGQTIYSTDIILALKVNKCNIYTIRAFLCRAFILHMEL